MPLNEKELLGLKTKLACAENELYQKYQTLDYFISKYYEQSQVVMSICEELLDAVISDDVR